MTSALYVDLGTFPTPDAVAAPFLFSVSLEQ